MFINIENGKLVLYDLKIYKKLEDINYKLSFEKGYEKITKEVYGMVGLGLKDGKIIDNKIVRFPNYYPTGRYIEYNDFYCDKDEIYNLTYFLYTLPKLYLILNNIIGEKDISKLEKLNDYFSNNKINKKELEIFNKYKDKIYRYLILEQIIDINCDVNEIKRIINILINSSKGQLKSKFINIENNLNIYNMNLDNLNHKIKLKK